MLRKTGKNSIIKYSCSFFKNALCARFDFLFRVIARVYPKQSGCIFSGSHKGLPLPLTGQIQDCFALQARNDEKENIFFNHNQPLTGIL
jgi:hypothetical protein